MVDFFTILMICFWLVSGGLEKIPVFLDGN